MLRLALAFTLLTATSAGFAAAQGPTDKPRAVAGESLRALVSGKRIYLEAPLGGELPLYYRGDGYVDGSGESAGLGRFLAPSDSGRWWVDGARLCQKWTQWYDGKTFCFTVENLGSDRIAWLRDDGAKGVARIAP